MLKPAAAMDPVAAREMITSHAAASGFKAGSVAALVAGSAVYTANTYSQAFRTRLGVSGKWGLVVSSFLGTFAIVAEKRILAGARNPAQYIASMDPNYCQPEEKHHEQLQLYKRAANFLYDHPYRTLAAVGVPLVGGIYAYQATNHALARSQQIMHTRIYGQGAIVLLLLGSMAFHDYMLHHGRFEVVSETGASGALQPFIYQAKQHTRTQDARSQ